MRDLSRVTTNFEDANKRKMVTFFFKISNELKRIFFE
jgi:preprotein translocase subunit SecE